MTKQNLRVGISTDEIEKAVQDEFEEIDDALDETASDLRSIGLRAAKNRIRKHDRIWNKEVLNSWVPFKTEEKLAGVRLYGFQNNAEHADVVDKGATYTDKKPPVAALIPWVHSNIVLSNTDMDVMDWAYWLQKKIFQEGIDGIHYQRAATKTMNEKANSTLEKNMK